MYFKTLLLPKKTKDFYRVGPADNWQGYDFYSPPDSARRAPIPSPKPTSISPLEIKGCKIQPKVSLFICDIDCVFNLQYNKLIYVLKFQILSRSVAKVL